MEQTESGNLEALPWDHGDFFSEEGFTKANDYFFQTHAKFSQTIQVARQAQGLAKASLRWKLNREIGEDFKLYTGVSIGEKAPEDTNQPLGIQGELDHLLATNYKKIAPTKPAESRVQEELTIVSHPLGPLEVCFCFCHYYMELTKRYASFRAGRRQTLKGLMDEEIFKWIWRLYYCSVLMPPEQAPDYYEYIPSTGLAYIPLKQQQISSPDKIIAIAQFLLGEYVASSHLRGPLCFYFVEFLRTTQSRLLTTTGRSRLEKAFEQVNKHKKGEGVDNVLVAIDANINNKIGASESFEDLFEDEEEEVSRIVAPQEQGFILNHMEFTKENFSSSLDKFVPLYTDGANQAQEQISLMPIVLVMRTMNSAMAEEVLGKIPGPFLNMIVNRLRFGGADSVSDDLMQTTAKLIETRRQSGERYMIVTKDHAGAVTATVRPKAAGRPGTGGGPGKKDPPAPQVQSPPAQQAAGAVPPGRDSTGAGSPQPGAVPGGARSARTQQEKREPETIAAGEPVEPSRVTYRGIADVRLIIGWQISEGELAMQSISLRQICAYTGFDPDCFTPWIVVALQTGQVAQGEAAKNSRQAVNDLLLSLSDDLDPESPGLIPEQEREQLRMQSGRMPAHEFLQTLHDCIGPEADHLPAGRLIADGVRKLTDRLGAGLEEFLRNPGQTSHRTLVQSLSREEKYTTAVLNRVGRLTAQ